ncbi:MAG: hypothetical protein J6J16_02215 [Lachnospiraceae bacterium]|nr:hypothetical protein [Lachnospiraceae bacterium]
MILRDVFLDIKEIFDFEYEKNPNGSYRVNTVIRKLVYPELYLSGTYSENDICYYLINHDYSYQSIPNIRNSFSELMNHTTMHKRFPVIFFSEQIDINKMYQYYDALIKKTSKESSGHQEKLTTFIKKISENDPTFNAHLKLICKKDYEFLTWIIIYAMFNKEIADNKFEEFIEKSNYTISNLSISESSERHKLSSFLYENKNKLNRITALAFVLSSLQIFFALIPYILSNRQGTNTDNNTNMFCIFLLAFSLFVLIVRALQTKYELRYADLQTYHNYMDEFPDKCLETKFKEDIKHFTIEPFNNLSNCNTSRERLRNSLKFFVYIMLILAIIVSFTANSFPILVALIFFFIIVVMFVDKHFHDALTRIVYDKNTSKEGELISQWKGIAKIYKWEYERTRFNSKDDYYKNTIHVHSGACYKHIFLIAHERLRYNLYIYTIVLLYFDLLFILVVSLNILLGDKVIHYLRFKDITTLNLLVTLFLLAIGIYTITTLIISRTSYSNLSLLAYASSHAEDNPAWAEKTFLSLYANGIIKDTDWMRGIFTYNVSLFEQGKTIDEIFPETDRMLFYHRQYVFRNNAKITMSLLYGILLAIFVWHLGIYALFVPITIGCILIYCYLCMHGLDRIHKKRIIHNINSLSN